METFTNDPTIVRGSTTFSTKSTNRQENKSKGRIVALIPAHNEERFIGSLVLAVKEFVDQVVVIDDGSNDRTAEIAARAGAVVCRHDANQGKAAAVNTGFAYVRQQHPRAVVMLDGDGQHYAEDLPRVLEPVLDGDADIVVGSRFLGIKNDIPIYRQVGQHGLTIVTNLATGLPIGDSQSGYRAFSPHAISLLSFSKGGFSIESEMQFLARECKLRVVEVPIKVTYDEPAKRNPFSHGMQVINGILQLVGQTRPLLFFGISGCGIMLLGIALGLHIIDVYTRTRQLAMGYSLLTVMLSIVGMLLFFAGVILHSVRSMIVDLRLGIMDRLRSEQDPGTHTSVFQSESTNNSADQSDMSAMLFERARGE
jgi:glycosyltransferase involved in cell wall biosynthesis